MSTNDERLKEYWRTISSLTDRLVGSTTFMREWARELPMPANDSEFFKNIMEELLSTGGGILKDALLLDAEPVRGPPFPEGGQRLVSPVSNDFVGGLKLLLDELSERIRGFPESEYHVPVLALLSADPHTLMTKFGSFTAAWDQLVMMKYATSVPNRRRRRVDAWFYAVVGIAERFLRDVIGVTILFVGRDLVSDALLACYRSPGLDIPHPRAEQLLKLSSLDDALVQATLQFMERGPGETTRYVSEFARAIGTSLFPQDELGIQPGILSLLSDFGDTSEVTWTSLLDARKAIVDETAQVLRVRPDSAPREKLYGMTLRQLELIAEYLCAFSFGFAMRLLAAVARRAEPAHPKRVAELQYRQSGELRVLVMRLLLEGRYALAWAIAEAALEVEPPESPGFMLRLNSHFARQRLGNGLADRSELERMRVEDVPKYHLLKEVLLGHLDRNHLEPILRRCLTIRDLSLHELDEWPALDRLRATPWWPHWRRLRHST